MNQLVLPFVTVDKLNKNGMKKYLFIVTVFMLPLLFSCSQSKEISERRNLMMPRLSEIPRNAKKYKEVNYSKRNKYQKKMYKKRQSNRR